MISVYESFPIVLMEVSPYVGKILKKIENDFESLKKGKITAQKLNKLADDISDFCGIKRVGVLIQLDFNNAYVLPVYNKLFSLDIINLLKNYQKEEKIQNIERVTEPTKYLKAIYVVIGNEMLEMLSAPELVGVLLHELGHAFTYTSGFPLLIMNILDKIRSAIYTLPGFVMKTMTFIALKSYVVPALVYLVFRTLTFLEHRGEYKADQFAVKYGYGDELAKVFHKYYHITERSKEGWFLRVLKKLFYIFTYGTTHPDLKDRIEYISEKIVEEYGNMYPYAKKELKNVFRDIAYQT